MGIRCIGIICLLFAGCISSGIAEYNAAPILLGFSENEEILPFQNETILKYNTIINNEYCSEVDCEFECIEYYFGYGCTVTNIYFELNFICEDIEEGSFCSILSLTSF